MRSLNEIIGGLFEDKKRQMKDTIVKRWQIYFDVDPDREGGIFDHMVEAVSQAVVKAQQDADAGLVANLQAVQAGLNAGVWLR